MAEREGGVLEAVKLRLGALDVKQTVHDMHENDSIHAPGGPKKRPRDAFVMSSCTKSPCFTRCL